MRRGEERLQLKWFAFAAVLFALSCVIAAAIWFADGDLPAGGQLLVLAAYSTIPVAAGLAILRHRLYDIDLVIRRTLVYGALTATLGADVPVGASCWSSLAVGESGLAVAVSTLAVAALFRPARARIQASSTGASTAAATTPRRRSRPSAAACATRSTSRRSAPTCGAWCSDTVQPAHVSLWLRRQT